MMNMNVRHWIASSVVLGLMIGNAFALDKQVEVSIEQIFAPSQGYDDNDEIQLVIDGKIPNLCYRMAQTEVSFNPEKKLFSIKQFAQLRSQKDCEEKMPPAMAFPFQYTKTLVTPPLEAGLYTVQFQPVPNQTISEIHFQVEKAPVEAIDNLPYAPVSNLFVPEIVYESKNVEVILTGVWELSCMDWDGVQVQNLGNVKVILPKLKMDIAAPCVAKSRPLQKIVSLGPLAPGRYLIHVRSMSGRAVNRVFSVLPDEDGPNPNRR